jgi:thymidylate kinase
MGQVVGAIKTTQDMRPIFIYITGADGTGKTTQAEILIQLLEERGIRCKHLWLRFPFFFSLPLLAYARWKGYSWYEKTEGVRHGYWDFRHSWLMRTVFPWALLLDATLASVLAVYLPLQLGYTIVCERYVLDMIVDLSVATGCPVERMERWGKCLLNVLPGNSSTFILDSDATTVRKRRPDLLSDRRLQDKLSSYRNLAQSLSLTVLDGHLPQCDLAGLIESQVLLTES